MTYQHIPLSSTSQTRLLVLFPSQDTPSPLVGSLRTCDLNTSSGSPIPSSPFEALSYVWGPPSSTHTLTIGASSLPITTNCDAALRQLRRPASSRILWIDSICIDQTAAGIRERNTQVAMMGDIYQAASDVLVWLGGGDDKTTALFRHLKRLYLVRDDCWENARHKLCARFMVRCDDKWKTSQTAAAQEVLENLLGRVWFERMWTLQELLLAKHATVMCGNQSMSWNSLFDALELIEASFPLSSKGTRNSVNCFYACSDFRELLENQDGQQTDDGIGALSRMMHHSRIRHASDPKDKVFALYGLSQKLGRLLRRPDYTQSIADIYTQATVAIIRHDNSLWPLENVWSANRRNDLPSWVPDWSDDCRWSDDELVDLGHVPLDPADRDVPSHWDGPTEPEKAQIKTSPDFKQLTLSGRALGIVRKVFDDADRVQAQADVLAAPCPSLQRELARRKHGVEALKLFRQLCSGAAAGSRSEARLVRLLLTYSPTQPEHSFTRGVQDLCRLLEEPDEDGRRYIFERAKRKWTRATDTASRYPEVLSLIESDLDAALDVILSDPETESRESWYPGDSDVYFLMAAARSLYHLVRGLCINRSIFVTDTGLLGYAHGCILEGDTVVKFAASSTPSVLGCHGAEFRLRGPAVVKAMMSMGDVYRDALHQDFVLS